MRDEALALDVARAVGRAGGRALLVGGAVRDRLMGLEVKDVDLEVYGISPQALRALLCELGEPFDKGAAFGVLGMRHSDIDVSMPRRERRTGERHVDFDVSVDPWLSPREASARRDFTMNAMLLDPLTGELMDFWGGQRDLEARVIRHVSDASFPEDALRVFRAAQFAARLNATVAPETVALCRLIDVSALSRERVFDELCKALTRADAPSVFFQALADMNQMEAFFPELAALADVPQNPVHHPEGAVLKHTMLVLDAAARLRGQAREPLWFMLSALLHDVGKLDATQLRDGKITAYAHPQTGVALARRQLRRLTDNARLIAYVENMVLVHMRPNMLAADRSRLSATRAMFDESLCPEDLILLSRADASGKANARYDIAVWDFLWERLADYRARMSVPMLTGDDLLAAGYPPGPELKRLLARAKALHFSGLDRDAALRQLTGEAPPPRRS